jgi:hypothetical protein
MASCGSNPDWSSRGQRDATVGRHFVKPPHLIGNAGRAPSSHFTPAFALQLRINHGKPVRVAKRCKLGKIRLDGWRKFYVLYE